MEKMKKIVIQLKTWLGKSDSIIGSSAKIVRRREIGDANILIADTKPIDSRQIRAAASKGNLKGIVRPGVGYDNIPLKLCESLGITCAFTPNAPSHSVAEFTLGLMISTARGIDRVIKDPGWNRIIGRELRSMKLGIVGLGRIGKRVAALASPLFSEILAYDPIADTTFDEIYHIKRKSFKYLLEHADILTIHIPKEGNIGLLDKKKLQYLKQNAIVINTSRGGIIHEGDLTEFLHSRPRTTAALDVFETEPYKGPLSKLPNALLTCHMASMTIEARDRMEREGLEAALNIITGKVPRWILPEKR